MAQFAILSDVGLNMLFMLLNDKDLVKCDKGVKTMDYSQTSRWVILQKNKNDGVITFMKKKENGMEIFFWQYNDREETLWRKKERVGENGSVLVNFSPSLST